jgi:lauroyl/myristoyl acyltransferase
LERVLHRFGPVVEAIANARRENFGYRLAHHWFKTFVNDISAQRQWKAIGLLPHQTPRSSHTFNPSFA